MPKPPASRPKTSSRQHQKLTVFAPRAMPLHSQRACIGPETGCCGCRPWLEAPPCSSAMAYGLSAAAQRADSIAAPNRSEEHTSELQSRENLVCRLLLEKKKYNC